MIKLQDLTPNIYYQQSRDFQFIGRLYDIVLNMAKTNASLIYNVPLNDNTDSRLIDLMALTLGFRSKHNYSIKQLTALCSAFSTIIKNKGNLQAIELAGNTLVNAEGITDEFKCEFDEDNYLLQVFIPEKFSDTSLLRDLLNYILPAGIQVRLITEAKAVSAEIISTLTTADNISYYIHADTDTSQVPMLNTIYILLKQQPSNWTSNTNYTMYYYKKNNTYVQIDEFYGANEHPWQSDTYYKKVSDSEKDTFVLLETKPTKWETTYFNYYIKDSDAHWTLIQKAPTWKANTYYSYQNITSARAKDTTGMLVNSTIIRPTTKKTKE